jgi:ribonuclease E
LAGAGSAGGGACSTGVASDGGALLAVMGASFGSASGAGVIASLVSLRAGASGAAFALGGSGAFTGSGALIISGALAAVLISGSAGVSAASAAALSSGGSPPAIAVRTGSIRWGVGAGPRLGAPKGGGGGIVLLRGSLARTGCGMGKGAVGITGAVVAGVAAGVAAGACIICGVAGMGGAG